MGITAGQVLRMMRTMWSAIVLFLIILTGCGPSSVENVGRRRTPGTDGAAKTDFDAGKRAYDQGDYATAFRTWLPLSEKGNALAQFYLGEMYFFGLGSH